MSDIIANLDRTELVRLVQEETRFPERDINRILDSFFGHTIKGVALTGYAEIHGLGSFKVEKAAPRKGKTPQGQDFDVPERTKVNFNPFERFREEVSTVTGLDCIV